MMLLAVFLLKSLALICFSLKAIHIFFQKAFTNIEKSDIINTLRKLNIRIRGIFVFMG